MRSENRHVRRLGLQAMLSPLLALCATGCPTENESLEHGFVMVQFGRSEAAEDSPYGGTTEIVIKMNYDGCFMSFYDTNPNYTQDGVDGDLAFGTLDDGGEGWMDRLCDPVESGQAECTILGFQQELEVANHLTVRYGVMENPENRFVKFGPLPLYTEIPEFSCEAGTPTVSINAQDMRGLGPGGEQIWQGEALDQQTAAPGFGRKVVVSAASG